MMTNMEDSDSSSTSRRKSACSINISKINILLRCYVTLKGLFRKAVTFPKNP